LLGASVVERIPWAKLGRKDVATALLLDPVQGGLWLGFRDGGVVHFKDSQLRRSHAGAEKLGDAHANDLHVDRHGTLWAATERGLSRMINGRVATLSGNTGLTGGAVLAVVTLRQTFQSTAMEELAFAICSLARP